MAGLELPLVGFIVVFLATLLLFGELLVRTRLIFGIIGAALFVVYFIYHLSNYSPTLMILLMVVGFVLVVVDGKVINNGSVALLGLILMMLACALPTPTWLYGVGVSVAFIFGVCGSFLFLKVFPARSYWSKITLMDQLSSERGYNSINEDYKFLIGKIGKSITPFRPVGTIVVEGKSYSAITNGVWLERDTLIKVISVDGTRIVIEPSNEKVEKGDNQ